MAHPNERIEIERLLGLTTPPVAVAFRPSAPKDVPHLNTVEPASCSYWRVAAEGKVFYTDARDHYNCPVGAHTHGVTLPSKEAQELENLIQTMVGLEYLTMEEIPSIPHRTEPFGVAIYAPLSQTPCEPDVILVRGNAKQIMLLTEAAQAAGVAADRSAMGRPTCAVLPEAIQTGRTALSVGCIGNRVYTQAGDDEMYLAIPGPKLAAVVEKLKTILRANQALETFHRARQERLTSP